MKKNVQKYAGALKIGTCSWNYDSWRGLVYSSAARRAADYLPQVAARYPTVEIDSWFYRIPDPAEAKSYLEAVPDAFRFTCKVPQEITLTHLRGEGRTETLQPNPSFLSPPRFHAFLEAVTPLLPRLDAIMFEFEYLNKRKMPSLQAFMERLGGFFEKAPSGLPYAVEPRNANYIKKEYFQFLNDRGLIHVFSEKRFMPHVYEVYENHSDLSAPSAVIRLLGGDRKEIEEATRQRWDRIVFPKDDKENIVDMACSLLDAGKMVTINVNNHYEGSAPMTIDSLAGMFRARGIQI
ncbi:DUF72 domain-containing protein [bacterium]|nr:DUF72 domain-containing protein [bacterium]